MSRFQVHPLTCATLRKQGKAQILSAELAARVASVWQRECATRAEALVDAPIFNVTGFGSDGVRGHFVPYSWWIAQLRHPELREILRVQPGTVCALSFAGENLLFGRRSRHSTQDPGVWEPVPAGGIGPDARGAEGDVAAADQLRRELEEEMGLRADQIAHLQPFALVMDFETRVHDIVFELELDASELEIAARFRERGTREVSDYRAVPRASLAAWTREHADEMSPITPVLLDAHASWRSRS